MAVDGNIGRGGYPESVGLIIDLSTRRTLVPVFVGPVLFKIMLHWPLI